MAVIAQKILSAVLISILLVSLPGSSREFPRPGLVPAEVVRVVDGDTFVASVRGEEIKIRLIGVDTPETVKSGSPVEPYGPEASAYTKGRLTGRTVYLEYDIEPQDYFGRDLCYVWLDANTLFNDELVRLGYARAKRYPPNLKYAERFEASEALAESEGAGLFSADAA